MESKSILAMIFISAESTSCEANFQIEIFSHLITMLKLWLAFLQPFLPSNSTELAPRSFLSHLSFPAKVRMVLTTSG